MPSPALVDETLLREAHHRIKASLQIVASLLTMQADAATDAVVKNALNDAKSRILTVALIHSKLSEASPRLDSVDMRAFIRELARHTDLIFSDPAKNVSVSLNLDPVWLPVRLAIPCGLLVGELLANAYRHAFAAAPAGVLEIRIASDEREVTVVVRDDGPGLPADTELQRGNGLGIQLIRLLATRQLRGQVSVDRGHGTTFTVRFPLLAEHARTAGRPPSSNPKKVHG